MKLSKKNDHINDVIVRAGLLAKGWTKDQGPMPNSVSSCSKCAAIAFKSQSTSFVANKMTKVAKALTEVRFPTAPMLLTRVRTLRSFTSMSGPRPEKMLTRSS